MTKVVKDRVLIMRDPKRANKRRIFHPGDVIPEHMEHLVTNGSVTGNDEDEEFDELEEELGKSEGSSESSETEEDTRSLHERIDDEYTVPQLTERLKEEGVDITGLSKKAELVNAYAEHLLKSDEDEDDEDAND